MNARDIAHEAVRDFAAAAERLLHVWTTNDGAFADHGEPTAIDTLLTKTYPQAIGMSFDEFVAELWAWEEQLLEPDPDVRCLACGTPLTGKKAAQ